MSDPGEAAKVCPDCGAENITLAVKCWMCHRDLKDVRTVMRPDHVQSGKAAHRDLPVLAPSSSSTALVVGATVLLVLLVGWGVVTAGPGALIPYAIIAVPALLATMIRVGRKSARGEKVGVVESIGTFLLSGVAVLGLLFMIGVTVVVGLFIYCLASAGRMS
jgi:hypothetical protein